MSELREAMARVVTDGGFVFLAIGAVSVVAWLLLFLKWLQLESSRINVDEVIEGKVSVSRSVLDMWIGGERGRLFDGLGPIEAAAALLPLLGLLGTVLGMLDTFEVIKIEGTGDPRLMANGIRKALLTTQAGILTAVPILLGLRLLSSRAAKLGNHMELGMHRSSRRTRREDGLAEVQGS